MLQIALKDLLNIQKCCLLLLKDIKYIGDVCGKSDKITEINIINI